MAGAGKDCHASCQTAGVTDLEMTRDYHWPVTGKTARLRHWAGLARRRRPDRDQMWGRGLAGGGGA